MGRRCLKRVWEWTGTWTLRQDLTSRFVYDGWNLVAEISDGGTVKKKYTWGNDVSGTAQGAGGVGGLLMIEILEASTYKQLYPIYDQGHHVRGLHDAAGAIVARYDYDTFGETFKANGNSSNFNGDNNYAEANPFRYSTKYTDNFSTNYPTKTDGLVYYGLRFYEPETGRFINRDPLQESGGLNLYGFVGNNPVNAWDYLGLETIEAMQPNGTTPATIHINGNDVTELAPFEVVADYNDPGYLDYLKQQRESEAEQWNDIMMEEAHRGRGGFWSGVADIGQGVIGVAGLIPVVGNLADAANAGISAARGNYGDAVVDGVSMIPAAGQFAGGGMVAVRVGRGGSKIVTSIKSLFGSAKSAPKDTKPFQTRRAALREAKRDAGIPTSQTHTTHRTGVKADKLDTDRTATEFEFEGGKQIQEHPNGHRFSDGSSYVRPHFNNHPETKTHYEYEKK